MTRSTTFAVSDASPASDGTGSGFDRLYGGVALTIGAFLCWYAIWTVECTALVLLRFHFDALLWAPILPTLVTIVTVRRYGPELIREYSQAQVPGLGIGTAPFRWADWSLIAGIVLLGAFAAVVGNRFPFAAPVGIAAIGASLVLWTVARSRAPADTAQEGFQSGFRLASLTILLLTLYYFAHRYDADDANYTNLAIGARRTVGAIYQFDTMIGDGPNPLHLPTYKFHSYELLAAVIAAYTGLSAIAVLHLVMPVIFLALTAMIFFAALKRVAGRYWFVSCLFVIALLFWNDDTLGSWGVHGLIRFQQGKGFLVTALLPLIAVLTLRWFVKRRRIDLVALCLANVCAIGLSANGLYGGPAASGLVAIAFVLGSWRTKAVWMQAVSLVPTIAWPAIVAILIVALKLALPSEVTTQSPPITQLNFVTGYFTEGRLLIALILLSPLAFIDTRLSIPALIYIPCSLILILNPLGYQVLSAVTGNLAFRIFWSMPVMFMVALAIMKLLISAGIRQALVLDVLGLGAIGGAIAIVAVTDRPETRIAWHQPSLKVDRSDWAAAKQIATIATPGCRILAPERYSALLTQIEGAPYPVFARELYLTHYRFTVSANQLRLRERLRLIVDGDGHAAIPTRADLLAAGVPVGTIAIDAQSQARGSAEALARSLGLAGPRREGSLLIWSGDCNVSLP